MFYNRGKDYFKGNIDIIIDSEEFSLPVKQIGIFCELSRYFGGIPGC